MIKQIDDLCRNYIWEGSEQYTFPPPMVWESICASKKAGGLGLKWLNSWNIMTLGKLVWWIAIGADSLWVKWVHHIYLRGQEWADYKPRQNCSWSWRRICKGKDLLWAKSEQWHQILAPKNHLGLEADEGCYFCGYHSETIEHLFFECPFSATCVRLVQGWLGMTVGRSFTWMDIKRGRGKPMVRRLVVFAAYSGLVHLVWMSRNNCRVDQFVRCPNSVVSDLKFTMRSRFRGICIAWKESDKLWLERLSLL
ncbi:hypothetical protein RND81_12G059300 [Saponaria officinalis]|uniref:Reverse transcriptase zinc-binding domain-containing protein n=1 Tax=Saponaria officinalis TaxID=3572 RepID=A0AAW1H6J9_SAPOF